MDKVIVKTNNPAIRELHRQTMKAEYEALCSCAVEDLPAVCAAGHDIHGLLIDSDLITQEQVRQIRAAVQDDLFPVILFSCLMGDKEIEGWLEAGVSEIIPLPLPVPLVLKRVNNVIRLYCVMRKLSGQSLDSLTGLWNRYAFYHHAQLMMQAQPDTEFTLVISDIENFRLINERNGEEKGDELLRYFGRELNRLNSRDALFARYGGDQFVGIMRRIPMDEEFNEDSVLQQLEEMFARAPVRHFKVKFGVYDNVDRSLPVSIMCDRAHMALKTVKHQYGRMIARYSPQMQQRFNREQQILDSMEEALENGQFQVYYQPKHDVNTAEIIGVEALARWVHPSYGFMSPGEFIPLFERNGFISQLDRYIWNSVCRDMKKWQEQGMPVVPVSVNASRRDILQDRFLETIRTPILKYGLDAELFHIEITETIYMEDAEILAPIIGQLQNWGIKIELDDFGSGFSSLGILSKLPLDVIKLDISLIRNLDTHPLIVESIIRLMHTLGYRVLAEGVETDEQLDKLRRMECDWVQGYYYSRPLTVSGLRDYMRQYSVKKMPAPRPPAAPRAGEVSPWASAFLPYDIWQSSYNVKVTLCLTEEVDGAILTHAVQRAAERYPYMMKRIVRRGEEYVLEDNPLPVVVYESDESTLPFNTEAVNYHLLSVNYSGNQIDFPVSRMLMGGTGLYDWVRTVLYLYLCNRYDVVLKVNGIKLPGDRISSEERAFLRRDALPEPDDFTISPSGSGELRTDDFTLARTHPEQACRCLYRFEFPQSKLMEKARHVDGSPASILSALMFRTLCRVWPDRKRPIQANITHNYRREVGLPESTCDLVRSIHVRYPDKLADAAFDRLCTVTRGNIILQSDPAAAVSDAHSVLDRFDAVSALPTLAEKREYCKSTPVLDSRARDSFSVSYSGQMDWGDMLPYIETGHAMTNGHLVLEAMSLGNRFTVSFQQILKDERYKDAFISELEREGIPYTVSGCIMRSIPDTILPD